MLGKLLIIHFFALIIETSPKLLQGHWERVTHGLNTFRRIRSVALKASNMGKVYYDENLEILAKKLVVNTERLETDQNYSSYFWVQTMEKDPEKHMSMYFDQLTRRGAHDQDVVTENTVNKPYNLAMYHFIIRMGCAQDANKVGNYTITTMLCAFGPSPVLLNDRLFNRGPVCTDCPLDMGCDNNLCDERTKAGLPALLDILGIRMSKSWQIFIGCALGVISLSLLGFVILLYVHSKF